jgi:hypothetical protein
MIIPSNHGPQDIPFQPAFVLVIHESQLVVLDRLLDSLKQRRPRLFPEIIDVAADSTPPLPTGKVRQHFLGAAC